MRLHLVTLLSVLIVAAEASSAGAQFLKGFDVYSGDGAVDWVTAKNSGITFAFVKATQGVTLTDARFAANMQGATNAGVYVGPYHFCNINTDANGNTVTSYDGQPFAVGSAPYVDAVSEANHFLAAIKPYYEAGNYLPPVADVEGLPDFNSASLNKTFISNWVQIFSDTILNSVGTRPIIYSSKSKTNEIYTSAVAAQHKLWIAWWKGSTASPPQKSDSPLFPLWSFWQYTNLESVPGVPGSEGPMHNLEDGDVFNGTLAQLQSLLITTGGVTGDYNRNGVVDASDYVLWRNTLYSTTNLDADGNKSGWVEPGDYVVWRAHLGQTAGSGSGGSSLVPEPSIVNLLGIGSAGVLFFRRGNRESG
jgi:GH25 family lysozyme M1 (1,4-beta-N-acetylmuramidase)